MKLILLNGAHGSGRDEAAKAFAQIVRRGNEVTVEFKNNYASLDRALVWPIAHLQSKWTPKFDKNALETLYPALIYAIVPDVNEPQDLIDMVEAVGVENVCLVNVFRPGFGDNTQPLGYDRKIGDGPLEHLDFNLYNDGPLDRLGPALAEIVQQWEDGATYVEKHTGA